MRESVVGPSQFVFALLEALFYPGAQPIEIANELGLVLFRGQVTHHHPSAISRQSSRVTGQRPVAPLESPTKDDFLDVSGFRFTTSKHSLERLNSQGKVRSPSTP